MGVAILNHFQNVASGSLPRIDIQNISWSSSSNRNVALDDPDHIFLVICESYPPNASMNPVIGFLTKNHTITEHDQRPVYYKWSGSSLMLIKTSSNSTRYDTTIMTFYEP